MNIEELQEILKKYERALDEEVWSSKLGKFLPFREFPNVKKILEEKLPVNSDQKSE
jgi:hypothetical protein